MKFVGEALPVAREPTVEAILLLVEKGSFETSRSFWSHKTAQKGARCIFRKNEVFLQRLASKGS